MNNNSQDWLVDEEQDVHQEEYEEEEEDVQQEELEYEVQAEEETYLDGSEMVYRSVDVMEPEANAHDRYIVSEYAENQYEADYSAAAQVQQESVQERMQRTLQNGMGQGSPSVTTLPSQASFQMVYGRLTQALTGAIASEDTSAYNVVPQNVGNMFVVQGAQNFGTYEAFSACIQLMPQSDQTTQVDFFLKSGSSSAFHRWANAVLRLREVTGMLNQDTMPAADSYKGKGMRALDIDDDDEDESAQEVQEEVANFVAMIGNDCADTQVFALQSLMKMVQQSTEACKSVLASESFIAQVSEKAEQDAELCRIGMALLLVLASEAQRNNLGSECASQLVQITGMGMSRAADTLESRMAQMFAQRANTAWSAIQA